MAAIVHRGTYIGYKVESTYGTAVTPDRFLRVLSTNVNKRVEIIRSEELTGATGSREASYSAGAQITAEGSIRTLVLYEGMGVLWQHLFRNTVSTGSPSSGYYPHTLHLGATASSLTVEVPRGNSGNAETFEGVKVTSWELSVTAGQFAELSMNLLGETTTGADDTPTSATHTTTQTKVISHHVTVTYNSTTYKCRSAKVSVDLTDARIDVLGSQLTQEPLPMGIPVVTFSAEVLAEDWSLIAAQQAETSASAVITIATGSYSMVFTMRLMKLSTADVDHSGNGPAYVQIMGMPLGSASATAPGLSVVITNQQSTFTAA